MPGFTSSSFGFSDSDTAGGGSTPEYVLPVITQTLNDGPNSVALGGSYTVVGVQLYTSAGANIENWEWSLGGAANPCTTISITLTTAAAYADALIYIKIKG